MCNVIYVENIACRPIQFHTYVEMYSELHDNDIQNRDR